MNTITIHAAKNNLSKLLVRVEAGEEIVLGRGDKPIAKIVPYAPPAPELATQKPKRQFGALCGQISLGQAFFEPLPEEELALWEGGGE